MKTYIRGGGIHLQRFLVGGRVVLSQHHVQFGVHFADESPAARVHVQKVLDGVHDAMSGLQHHGEHGALEGRLADQQRRGHDSNARGLTHTTRGDDQQ